ncbi:MAG: glycerol-3-phosphate dehydrogenase/oxidase [Bdellovibrionales bacterium]|nr:glycerol-3-phosphate dehydrogenase/oxidase [Bdellovibrionales bacterium]
MDATFRKKKWQDLSHEPYDLLIVGGGINGAGIARDAASRGLKVVLIEAADFASGTSSRSSKLIHGGIRYLENLEFGLVFEALSERRKLFQIAPHLVHPLRFVIPLYKGGRVGMAKMGLGMWLYDALALFDTPEGHERLSVLETQGRFPLLQESDLLGSYAYSDAYMDDDRLVLETLRSAENFGAQLINYCRAQDAIFAQEKVIGVLVKNELENESKVIKARHIVSTVGPWTDRVAPHLVKNWQPCMRPSKGVHLTFSRKKFPLSDAVVMAAEKRIVFAIPRHEMVIVGTTDTDFLEDPSQVTTSIADVNYLFTVIEQYFPHAKLKKSDVIASYSGVRPLVHDEAQSESKTSREHLILNTAQNVTFVMGGKYTTYRHIAEQAVQSILSFYPLSDQVQWNRSQTLLPLNPLIDEEIQRNSDYFVDQISKSYALPLSLMRKLFARHGRESETILSLYFNQVSETSHGEQLLWNLEAAHAIHNTMCMTLADFYLRRTPLFLGYDKNGFDFLPGIKKLFQSHLGLTDRQIQEQDSQLEHHLEHEMGWREALEIGSNSSVNA